MGFTDELRNTTVTEKKIFSKRFSGRRVYLMATKQKKKGKYKNVNIEILKIYYATPLSRVQIMREKRAEVSRHLNCARPEYRLLVVLFFLLTARKIQQQWKVRISEKRKWITWLLYILVRGIVATINHWSSMSQLKRYARSRYFRWFCSFSLITSSKLHICKATVFLLAKSRPHDEQGWFPTLINSTFIQIEINFKKIGSTSLKLHFTPS